MYLSHNKYVYVIYCQHPSFKFKKLLKIVPLVRNTLNSYVVNSLYTVKHNHCNRSALGWSAGW